MKQFSNLEKLHFASYMQNPIAEPLKLQSTSSLVWSKRWICCAGALLFLIAFSKWLSVLEGEEVLAAVYPPTGIRCGKLLTVAIFLELCLAYAAFEFPLGLGNALWHRLVGEQFCRLSFGSLAQRY